ncbi:MAG: cation diffusion facilitator family transporter, partial [Bacteroidia bacterium]|nr:cation diffusion facilitator family transporter [Bacteroidia bacterium]
PKDQNHPYGHGKIEFISAGVEGGLIASAGVFILYRAISSYFHPSTLKRLDWGMLLIATTAVVNYYVGYLAIRKGKKNCSLALIASGKHLQTDTYSTLCVVIGLLVITFTRFFWLDSLIASSLGLFIIYTGFRILRSSIAGIMDEADEELLRQIAEILQKNRRANWIDIHNLRIIKYGGNLHIDCHLTLPWYFNVREAHQEIDLLEKSVRENLGENVEMFIHADDCYPFSCRLCSKHDCVFRIYPFEKQIVWNSLNLYQNKRHRLS